jgi:hypothetical protein
MCRHRGWKYNLYMHESGVKGTEKLTLMSLYEPWRGSRSPKDLSVGRLSTSLTIEAFIIDILLLLIVTADVLTSIVCSMLLLTTGRTQNKNVPVSMLISHRHVYINNAIHKSNILHIL